MTLPSPTLALEGRYPTFGAFEPGIGSSFDLGQREPMGVGRGYPLDNNPFAAILGPPNEVKYVQRPEDLQPKPFVSFAHSYEGTNAKIEQFITFSVVEGLEAFETSAACIPWEHTEEVGQFVAIIRTFEPMIAPVITELAPARHLESRTEMKVSHLQFRGAGFRMTEHHFTTPSGQQDLRNNLIALAKSIVLTVKELTIQALINANTAEQNAQIYYGMEEINRNEKMFEETINGYVAAVKPEGYRYFVNNITRRTGNFYNVNGFAPTSLLVPQRISYTLESGHKELTEYKTAGPPDNRPNQFKLSSLPNLLVALITSTMVSGTISEPMIRYSATGEFFTVGATPAYRAKKFKSTQRDVFVYNTAKDVMDRVKYFEALEKTQIWDVHGQYSKKFENWFNKMTNEWELGDHTGRGEMKSSNTINPAPFISSKDNQKRLRLATLFGHLSDKITDRDFRYSAETIMAQAMRGMSEDQFMNEWTECEKILTEMNQVPANDEFFTDLVLFQYKASKLPTTKTPVRKPGKSDDYKKGIPIGYLSIDEFKQNQYGGLNLPTYNPNWGLGIYPPGYNNYGGLMTLAMERDEGWAEASKRAQKVLSFVSRLSETLQDLLPSSLLLDKTFCPPWNHNPTVSATIIDALVGFQAPLFLETEYAHAKAAEAPIDPSTDPVQSSDSTSITYKTGNNTVTIPKELIKYSRDLGEIHFFARMTQGGVDAFQWLTGQIESEHGPTHVKEADSDKKALYSLLEEVMALRPRKFFDNYIGLATLYFRDNKKDCFRKLVQPTAKDDKTKVLNEWISLTPIDPTLVDNRFLSPQNKEAIANLVKEINARHVRISGSIKSKTGVHLNLDPASEEHKELLKTHGKVEGVKELSAKCGELMKMLHEEEEGEEGEGREEKEEKRKISNRIAAKGRDNTAQLFLRTPLNCTDGLRASINIFSKARPGSNISQYTSPDLLLTDLPSDGEQTSFLNTQLGKFFQISSSFGKLREPPPSTTFSHTSKVKTNDRKSVPSTAYGENAFFSELYRPVFHKRFVNLKREGNKLLRMILMCFYTTRCDNWGVLKALYENDIYFPISVLVMSPFIVCQTACVILMKGGLDTGSNYYGKQSLLFTQDNRIASLDCRYDIRLGTVIRKRKNICLIPEVAPVGYVGGGNTKWIETREDYKVKFRELTEYHPSLVSTICPPCFAAEQNKYIHTAGFDPKKSLEDQPNGWECSGFIHERFGLETFFGNFVPSVHNYHTEGHVRAEILCRTTTLTYNPKQRRFSTLDRGTGHRQDLRYPGARAVWQGEHVGKAFDFSQLVLGAE